MDEVAVRFDTALPILGSLIVSKLGLNIEADGYFLRDGFGRVAYFTAKTITAQAQRQFNSAAESLLGGHAFPAGALQITDNIDVTGQAVLSRSLTIDERERTVRIVDRRLIGRDWLTAPAPVNRDMPPIVTFGSLKGGVGRTTALFVLATFLARQGRNVLLVDLDLEAPGLASLVFGPGEGPAFGALEYLVERRLRSIPDSELHEYVGTSTLTDRIGGHGRVDLLPATGTQTHCHPHTMLAKLARAMVESPSSDGPILLSTQIREMVTRFAKAKQYDAILVDARAGLAELTAAPLLGLGGSVVLFGTEHRHTFEGFRYLTAHMGLLPAGDGEGEWRERLHFVHAKASARTDQHQAFNDQLYEVLAETLYDKEDGLDAFSFSLDDEFAPHHAWVIYHDTTFLDATYAGDPDILASPILTAVFGDFIAKAVETLSNAEETLRVNDAAI